MVRIGNVVLNGRVVLGPMAGVTDFAFRAVCRAQGAALTTTEMVSAKALVYRDEQTKAESPCVVPDGTTTDHPGQHGKGL